MIGWMIGGSIVLLIVIFVVSWSLHIKIRIRNTVVHLVVSARVAKLPLLKKKWEGDWLKHFVEACIAKKNKSRESPKRDTSSFLMTDNRQIAYLLWRAIRCRRFSWQLELGLDDAAQTAIATGIVTAVQGLGRMLLEKKRCNVRMMCRPDFGKMILRSELECIITFRLGNLIKELMSGFIKRKVEKIR